MLLIEIASWYDVESVWLLLITFFTGVVK